MTRTPSTMDLGEVPAARRRLYAALVVLFPFALLAAGELLARLFYHPESTDLFQEQTVNGVVYRTIDPAATSPYFPTLAIRPGTATDLFRARKAPGTIRIFALGASSTLGYPYMMNGSFPAMIRDRLRERYPDRTIEMVNLGVTAVTSHTVLDFGLRSLEEDPDLLIVYTGHNEYYGALGVGSSQFVGSARWIVRTYLALHNSRLFLAFKSVVTSLARSIGGDASNRTGTLMELMARETAIPFGSPMYERGKATYQANLEALLDGAASRHVPVILTTLVSNLKDLPPLHSVEPETWTPEQRDRVKDDLMRIDSALLRSDHATATALLAAWAPSETLHAGLAFRRAGVEASRGNWKAADDWYRRARDLDGVRFRAPSVFNELLRSYSGRPGILIADAESVMVRRAPHGIIGREYLLEHVHPNLHGYTVIADAVESAVLAVLSEKGIPVAGPEAVKVPPNVTRVDSIVAAYRIQILVNSWPFTTKGLTLADLKASTWEEELALRFLREEFTWEALHVRAAEAYERSGRLPEAADEYRALMAATPYNVSPTLRLGVVLQRAGDLEGAQAMFRRSLAVEPTATAHLKLGEIAYEKGQHDVAVECLTQALRTGQLEAGRIPEIKLAIALATLRGGHAERARSLAEALVEAHPEFEQGRTFLAFVRKRQAPGGKR
jgi:tetratricopeptide (TPR) repeat protein